MARLHQKTSVAGSYYPYLGNRGAYLLDQRLESKFPLATDSLIWFLFSRVSQKQRTVQLINRKTVSPFEVSSFAPWSSIGLKPFRWLVACWAPAW